MNTYGLPFDICEHKHGGNPQSLKANQIAHKYKIGARQRIIEQLQLDKSAFHIGMTCEELEKFTGMTHQTCSARISELKREGKIKQVGTRKTRSGAPAAVYQAV